MKRNIKLASLAAILAVLLAVSAYAAITYYTPNIPMTGNVFAYEAQLFRLDTGTQVTNIPWGNLSQGASVTTDTLFGFTQQLVMKNTGDYKQWLGWQINGTLPAGVTLTCQYYAFGTWYDLAQNVYYVGGSNWNNGGLEPGDTTKPVQFVLSVASNAPRGPFTININIVAVSTQSG